MRASALASKRKNLRCALLIAACALLGCNLNNPGDEPPDATLYFPNAMTLSPHEAGEPARYLFLANSNFDLRYKSGTLQAYSLEDVDDALADCDPDEECVIPAGDALEDEVRIDSFGTALTYSSAPEGAADPQDYVFVTTRTDDSLAFVRVDPNASGDDVLSCAGGDSDSRCDLLAVRGQNLQTGEPLEWPPDPVAVIAGPLSDWSGDDQDTLRYVLVAHRRGAASIFLEQARADTDENGRFELVSVLQGLPSPLTNVAFDPTTRLAHLTVGLRGLARVGFAPPGQGAEGDVEGTLYNAGTLSIDALSVQPDTRDLLFIPAIPDSGEALERPSALVVADNPSALLLVDVDETDPDLNRAQIKGTAVVGAGASRVTAGTLRGRPTAVVACFDARTLFVIDVETMLSRSVVPNLSGPFALTLDEARERLYVADFRSSVIRIVDLSGLAETEGEVSARVIGTIGTQRVLQELR